MSRKDRKAEEKRKKIGAAFPPQKAAPGHDQKPLHNTVFAWYPHTS